MTGRRPAIAGLLVISSLLTGACTVSRDPTQISRQDQFEHDRAVRYDLSTKPRDAQQLGVEPGTTTGAFNRVGDHYWSYEITLPGGRLFRTQGFGHRIIVDPENSNNSVLINSRAQDIDAAQQELLAVAPVLGLDPTQITRWASKARVTTLTNRNPIDSSGFVGAHLDYLTVDVEVRRSQGEDHVVINYDFLWDQPSFTGTTTPGVTPGSASARP